MFYLIVSGASSPYAYVPFIHIRTLKGQSLAEMQQQIPGYTELLQPGNGYSCIHCTIYSVDEDTGALDIHYNHMGKVPLKKRKVINALAEGTIKKAKQPQNIDASSFFASFDDLVEAAIPASAPEVPF